MSLGGDRCNAEIQKRSDWDRSRQVNRTGSLLNRSISVYTKTLTDHNSRTTNCWSRDLVPGDRPHPYATFIHTSYSENSHAQGVRSRWVVAPYITLNTMVPKVGEVLPPTFGFGCSIHCSSQCVKNRWSSDKKPPCSVTPHRTHKWPFYTSLKYRKIVENDRNQFP